MFPSWAWPISTTTSSRSFDSDGGVSVSSFSPAFGLRDSGLHNEHDGISAIRRSDQSDLVGEIVLGTYIAQSVRAEQNDAMFAGRRTD